MFTARTVLHVCLVAAGVARGQELLTLKSALDQTERLSPELAEARLRMVETAAFTKVTASAMQPQVQLGVQMSYQTSNLQGIGLVFPGFPSRIGPFRSFNARPQVTQTILDLSLLAEVRTARARQKQTALDARAIRDDLAIAVVQLYLQALQARSRSEASTERLRTAQAILDQAKAKEQVGTSSKLDVARAAQQVENEYLIGIDANRDSQVLESLLLKAIGREQISGIRLERPTFTLLVENEVQKTAQDLRPDLLAIEAKAEVAGLERKAVEKQKLPKVSAFADYGLLGAGPDRSIGTYTVGFSITVPIWTGKRIESQTAVAQVRADQAAQQAKRLRLQIQQEVRQASIEMQSARESLQAATRATISAREILELSRLRFESGLATSVDTQIAQSNFATAEDQRIQHDYAVLLSEARLAKAGGILSLQFVK